MSRSTAPPTWPRCTAHVYDPVPAASEEVPGLPRAFDVIIARCLAKDPAERFGSADEVAAALREAAAHELGAPTAQTPAPPTAPAPASSSAAPPAPAPPAAAPPAPAPAAAAPPGPAPAAAAPPAPAPPAAAPPGPAPGPRRRRNVGALVAGLTAVAGIIAVVALTSGGGGAGRTTVARTTGGGATRPVQAPQVLTGASVGFHGPFALNPGTTPVGLAADGVDVWVAEPERGRVVRVGPDGSGASFTVAGHPDHVAVDALGHVWVTPTGPAQVTMLDPATGRQTAVAVGRGPRAIAISAGAAWVADTAQGAVTRIDLRSLATQTIPVPSSPAAIGSAYGRVWVAGSDGSVTVLDESGQSDDTAGPTVPPTVLGIAHSDGVWFLSAVGAVPGKLTRVNPIKSTAVIAGGRARYVAHPDQGVVGTDPAGITASGAAADHTVWVTSAGDRSLRRIGTSAPHDKQTLTHIAFPRPPGPVAVGDQGAWVEIPSTGQLYLVTGP